MDDAFISGTIGLLRLHSFNALLLLLTSLALIPFTIHSSGEIAVHVGRFFSVALWVTVLIQADSGFLRLVGLHIPMGTALIGLTTGFAWWAFSYRSTGRQPAPATRPPAMDSTLAGVTVTTGQEA